MELMPAFPHLLDHAAVVARLSRALLIIRVRESRVCEPFHILGRRRTASVNQSAPVRDRTTKGEIICSDVDDTLGMWAYTSRQVAAWIAAMGAASSSVAGRMVMSPKD